MLNNAAVWVEITFIAVLAGCAFSDITARIIPNVLCALVVALGFAEALLADRAGVALSILMAVAAFLLLMPLQQKNVLGGGDVKLIAALLVWLTPLDVGRFLLFTLAGGGVLGLLFLGANWIRGVIRQDPAPKSSVPYGVAIVFGFLAVRPNLVLDLVSR